MKRSSSPGVLRLPTDATFPKPDGPRLAIIDSKPQHSDHKTNDIQRRLFEQLSEAYALLKIAEDRQKLLEAELHSHSSARIILDASLKVIFVNASAKHMLEHRSTLCLQADGYLRSQSKASELRLKSALETLYRNRQLSTSIIDTGGIRLAIRCLCIDENPCGQFAITVHDSNRPLIPDLDLLRSAYSLTHAEARLASLLAQGLTIDETTESLCISRHTVRAHLRALFLKTGVSRQADLVRKVLSGPAMSF